MTSRLNNFRCLADLILRSTWMCTHGWSLISYDPWTLNKWYEQNQSKTQLKHKCLTVTVKLSGSNNNNSKWRMNHTEIIWNVWLSPTIKIVNTAMNCRLWAFKILALVDIIFKGNDRGMACLKTGDSKESEKLVIKTKITDQSPDFAEELFETQLLCIPMHISA